MRATTTVKWVAAFVLAASLTVKADGTGGTTGGGQGGPGQGKPDGQHQRPSPEQIMAKFDANKDGELSQDELTKALEDLRAHRPQGPGSAEKGGAATGEHRTPPPADKVAARMIEKFASDKKVLTQAELGKALEDHHANHEQQGGGSQQGDGNASGSGAGSN